MNKKEIIRFTCTCKNKENCDIFVCPMHVMDSYVEGDEESSGYCSLIDTCQPEYGKEYVITEV